MESNRSESLRSFGHYVLHICQKGGVVHPVYNKVKLCLAVKHSKHAGVPSYPCNIPLIPQIVNIKGFLDLLYNIC